MFVGTFGTVVFEASSLLTRTFDDFKRQGSARFATHEVINQKQVLEYLGENTENISFSMILSAALNVNPFKELEILRAMRATGESQILVIGGKKIGSRWVIKNLDESITRFDGVGTILSAIVNISLEEDAHYKRSVVK